MQGKLFDQARQWIDHDPDPATRQELEMLLRDNDRRELAERFGDRLEFGTAGLRAKIGAGPMRFNRAVVIQTTDGLARYLFETNKRTRKQGIVIGYDARRFSKEFAQEAAQVLGGHGIKTYLFTDSVPTPLLAYAVLKLRTAAGIMITASHNARDYNGYKIYWENGAQLLFPHDANIARKIASAWPADQIARPSLAELKENNLLTCLTETIIEAYIEAVLKQRLHPGLKGTHLKVLYTPLHGVGYPILKRITAKAGYTGLQVVSAQALPDGEFPTLSIPNPEDKKALSLALTQASSDQPDLILANDPDADRLAACFRCSDNSFKVLNGDQIGILLADYLFTELKANRRMPSRPLVLTTVVSSRLLKKLAEAHEIHYEETLTGFKWINNRALELEAQGYTFLFGYEEAIGYCVGPVVRDKDGLSAALLFLEMTAWYQSQKRTILDRLSAIYNEFGFFDNHHLSYEFKGAPGQEKVTRILARLRENPPKAIGDIPVRQTVDYLSQQGRQTPGGKVKAPPLPKSNMISFELASGDRILVRPSGTEPKVKIYFETFISNQLFSGYGQGQLRAANRTKSLVTAFVAIIGLGSEGR